MATEGHGQAVLILQIASLFWLSSIQPCGETSLPTVPLVNISLVGMGAVFLGLLSLETVAK